MHCSMADQHPGASAALALCLSLTAPSVWAFNEPTDTAGPLTASIDGPAIVTDRQQPLAVGVVLNNSSADQIQGTLRLGVIDDWRAVPQGDVPFVVEGRRCARFDFKVFVGEDTFNAHYPIHAWAESVGAGQHYSAHPVLIVQTQLPDPPRPHVPMIWRPLSVHHRGAVALWRWPIRRVQLQVFGESPRVMPLGWSGSDAQTRASVQFGVPIERGNHREAFAVHPPWHAGGAGSATVEIPLNLPDIVPATLKFATAIRDHDTNRGEPRSDGVTFRVRVAPFTAPATEAGELLWQRHSDSKTWEAVEVRLDRFAGQAIRLQLETDPGPQRNTTCDQCYWAEPELVVGAPLVPVDFPPRHDAAAQTLGSLRREGVRYLVRLWPGQRGLMDTVVGLIAADHRLLFRGFHVRVLGDDLADPRSPSLLLQSQRESKPGVHRVRHLFRTAAGQIVIIGELAIHRDTLQARFTLNKRPEPQPWQDVRLEGIALGPWSAQLRRVYAGIGSVIEHPEPFTLRFDGHRLASSFVGFEFDNGFSLVQAVDVPPDELRVDSTTREYSLRTPHDQTITLVPGKDVWQAARGWRAVNGLRAASGVPGLAGRFVFDLWGGRYGESRASLERAFRYGLTDSLVVWHNWQHWGYDYRLPDIFPANPGWGREEEFRQLTRLCNRYGVLFAPHDNYIDFYPDAEQYSYKHIAFTAARQPVRAWLNRGREAQSYRWRADHVRPFLERNLRLIHDAYAPTAYFIDVWSSICPYDYWTHDGQFHDRVATRDGWRKAFAWIRALLGDDAPQISESGHDQLIGWLDGAQANHLRVDEPPEGYFRWAVWPIRCGDAERVPWFDTAHHDRFVLHGAGYPSRYAAGLDHQAHGTCSDDYISTEVLTGHPAMVSAPFGRDVVRKYWLLHDLMRALALRTIEGVMFTDGNLHRQHVRWSAGGEVWVNRGESDWTVASHVLPQYGFYARIPNDGGIVEAAIERHEGQVVEWSRSPRATFANARTGRERQDGNPAEKRLAVGGVRTNGAVQVRLTTTGLLVIPLPESRLFDVVIDAEAVAWPTPVPNRWQTLSEDGRIVDETPVTRAGDKISIRCQPGVFAYRLAFTG